MDGLDHAALVAVRDCLAVQAHETLLVVTDSANARMARSFVAAGRSLAREILMLEFEPRQLDGQEPPSPVPRTMAAVDAVLAITTCSITHTAARRAATAAGTRVASIPGITEDSLIRTLNVSSRHIAQRTRRAAHRLTNGVHARITTPAGTDITVPIRGIDAVASTGMFLDPGDWGELPAGRAGIRPEEGKAEGILVVDGSLVGVGKLRDPVRITISKGLATTIDGGAGARRFERLLQHVGAPGRTLAGLGIGTNDRSTVTGFAVEDVTALGTVHVTFGNNTDLGGTINLPCRLGGVLLNPTLLLDGRTLIDAGRLLLD